MLGANIQTFKANFTSNFGSNIKSQSIKSTSFIGPIKPIGPTNFIGSTEFISAIKFTSSTKYIGNIIVMGITNFLFILEDITQQLLESKHTFILGQFFKIVLDLKQCVVAKLAFG
jgi:hypothetical protein